VVVVVPQFVQHKPTLREDAWNMEHWWKRKLAALAAQERGSFLFQKKVLWQKIMMNGFLKKNTAKKILLSLNHCYFLSILMPKVAVFCQVK